MSVPGLADWKPKSLEETGLPRWVVEQRRSLPLDCKVKLSQMRIRQWYEHWNGQVYICFSGGKDSTVLLDLVWDLYPDVPAVFFNTRLEFPEIVRFVRSVPNVIWRSAKMTPKQVIDKYGYPFPSKDQAGAIYRYRNATNETVRRYRLEGFPGGKKGTIAKKWRFLLNAPFLVSDQCCEVMKERPGDSYARESGRCRMTGEMAGDSDARMRRYMRYGCNAFGLKSPVSRPMSVWNEQDVWEYIKQRRLPYAEIYNMGYRRTGCVFCMFGVCREEPPNRFQRLRQTHPKLWRYCMDKLGMRAVLGHVGIPIE